MGRRSRPRPHAAAFPYLPYSLAFQRACAVVHQGGIGTLAQALAAGHPQLIVPVAFDQPDNARRAARLGVASALPFRKATSANLAAALQRLIDDRQCSVRARELASGMRAEDGAGRAADLIVSRLR